MSKTAREVQCPFCWVMLGERVPMVFDGNTAMWQCVRGNHTAANFDDEDEQSFRERHIRRLEEQAQDQRARHAARKYIKAMYGPIDRSKSAGSSSGRKRTKPKKWDAERPGTLV